MSNISIIGKRPQTCIMLVLFKSAHYSDSLQCTQFMLMDGIRSGLPPAASNAVASVPVCRVQALLSTYVDHRQENQAVIVIKNSNR